GKARGPTGGVFIPTRPIIAATGSGSVHIGRVSRHPRTASGSTGTRNHALSEEPRTGGQEHHEDPPVRPGRTCAPLPPADVRGFESRRPLLPIEHGQTPGLVGLVQVVHDAREDSESLDFAGFRSDGEIVSGETRSSLPRSRTRLSRRTG